MMKISEYIGCHVSKMLGSKPFKDWSVERSFEDELEEPIMHYIFKGHGLELRCNQHNTITVIFLDLSELVDLDCLLLDVPPSASRLQVYAQLGTPSQSGEKLCDPILGNYGAWDRFVLPSHAIHIEYQIDSDCIQKMTMMGNEQ